MTETTAEWLDKRAKAPYEFKEQSIRAVKFSDALRALEIQKQETFKISSGILRDIIERIKKQDSIYWNTGQSKRAYPVSYSLMEQFEITLEAMENASQQKQEKE